MVCGVGAGAGCMGAGDVAGDVAGVSSRKGLSENVIDNGLYPVDEGGSELRVPDGEPSRVNIACCGCAMCKLTS